MNKVMTRTRRLPRGRPPVRHDTRRRGSAPRRTAPPAPPHRPLRRPAPRGPERPAPRPLDAAPHPRPRLRRLAHLAERGPLRTAHGARPVVRDIGYYVPRPGAIEAFARIGAGDRLRAMAFRLEHGPDRRWRCTAVELDGPACPAPEAGLSGPSGCRAADRPQTGAARAGQVRTRHGSRARRLRRPTARALRGPPPPHGSRTRAKGRTPGGPALRSRSPAGHRRAVTSCGAARPSPACGAPRA